MTDTGTVTSADGSVRTPLRVALLGTRGVPARYGGSETAAEEIYSRLAARGHEITVYCRRHKVDPKQSRYRGIRTVVLPSLNTKSLDTLTHSVVSIVDLVVRNRADIAHFHGIGNAILFPFVRLFGKKVVVGVDGMDWTRHKWNRFEQLYLRLSLHLAVKWSDAVYVDSLSAQRFCRELFGSTFPLVSYGAEVHNVPTTAALEKLGLAEERYVLFVGRLIPEKGVHYLVKAFEKVNTDMRLVIVGDNPYHRDYVQGLKSTPDPRILFTGPLYGDGFWELCSHCYFYVQPSEVEGTSPVLLSAMACGRCVVVNGIQENLDVIGDAGVSFAKNDVDALAREMIALLANPDRVHELGQMARTRVQQHYNWDTVALQTEDLYYALERERVC